MKAVFGVLRWLLMVPVLFVLANCQTSGPTTTVVANTTDSTYQAAQAASYAPGPTIASSPDGSGGVVGHLYRIAPHDTLQITVFQVPDMSKTAQVNGIGLVEMPLIGPVPVAGLTAAQAQQEIAARLGKSYLRSPQVTVHVTKSGQRVVVNGAVGRPAVLTIDGELTLNQAVSQAGGVADVGNSYRVHLARVSGQHVHDTIYNLHEIQAGRIPDPRLQGGDIIVVEQSAYKITLKTIREIMPFMMLMTLL